MADLEMYKTIERGRFPCELMADTFMCQKYLNSGFYRHHGSTYHVFEHLAPDHPDYHSEFAFWGTPSNRDRHECPVWYHNPNAVTIWANKLPE